MKIQLERKKRDRDQGIMVGPTELELTQLTRSSTEVLSKNANRPVSMAVERSELVLPWQVRRESTKFLSKNATFLQSHYSIASDYPMTGTSNLFAARANKSIRVRIAVSGFRSLLQWQKACEIDLKPGGSECVPIVSSWALN